MVEHTGEYEWNGEGAEVVVYAPDEETAGRAFEGTLPAARIPGVESPVHAAASPEGLGWVAVSGSHAVPDALSPPARGVLLVADIEAESLGMPPRGVVEIIRRDLAEINLSLPPLNEAGARRFCEEGALAAAEDGLVEEEDLALLAPVEGDPDALGRRALAAGTRDWEGRFRVEVSVVGEILDTAGAETLDLRPGTLVLAVSIGAGDLGRLALAAHRERIFARIRAGVDFGAEDDLPAAPVESEEAADLLAAVRAASNFADARAARTLYTLRRLLRGAAGGLDARASWRIGGLEERGGLVHRRDLASVGEGEPLISGGVVAAGTGMMSRSAPQFGVPRSGGRWPWEEAGLLERWADLDPTGGES